MSRSFWVALGAVGGVVAYRRGTRAVTRAKELGPLGTAQLAAQSTSKLAGRTAHGLGRLQDARARREGRLVIGTAQDATAAPAPVPADWVPAPGPQGSPRSSSGRRDSGDGSGPTRIGH